MPSIQAVLRRRDTIQPPAFLKSRLKKLGPRATVVALQPLDLVKRRALDQDLGARAFGRKKTPPSFQFAPLQRRHSFHTLTDEEPTLLHDLRSYFDPSIDYT